MKTEWSITHLIAVGFPAREKCEISKTILNIFLTIQVAFKIREPVCDLEINENRVIDYQCNHAQLLGPLPDKNVFFGEILDIFWSIQAAFVVGESLFDLETPS